jgi:hypothetical protein
MKPMEFRTIEDRCMNVSALGSRFGALALIFPLTQVRRTRSPRSTERSLQVLSSNETKMSSR